MVIHKTKVLATLGPAIDSYDKIRKLVIEGVDGFRINYSHGDQRKWDEWVKTIREIEEELDKPITLIGDLPGPQIRIGNLPVQELKARERVKIVLGEDADRERYIPVNNRHVFEALELGDIVLLDDGKIILRVIDVREDEAEAIVLNDSILKPHKTLVIFGKELDLPVISDRDIDLVKYTVTRNITYLMVSFIRSMNDVSVVRDVLSSMGGQHIGVISKIETRSAVRNLKEIIMVSDAVVIARGDLGMHYSLEELPALQRRIAWESIMQGKPCIVATQLLETMVNYPRPSRSEVVDVMNAVYDLVDALLLTNETAVGKYPVETVKWLKRIISSVDHRIVRRRINDVREKTELTGLSEKYALGLTLLAEKINAKILLYTKTASIPPQISRFRPQVEAYVGTISKNIAEKLTIYYSLKPYHLKTHVEKTLDYEQGVKTLYQYLKNRGEINYGEIIAEAYGRRETRIHEIRIKQVI